MSQVGQAVDGRGRQVGDGTAEQGGPVGGIAGHWCVAVEEPFIGHTVDIEEDQQVGAVLQGVGGAEGPGRGQVPVVHRAVDDRRGGPPVREDDIQDRVVHGDDP